MIRIPIDMAAFLPLTRRHAVDIAQTAEAFECRVMLAHEKGVVNAKSMLGLLTLGEAKSVVLELEGEDEEEARAAMIAVLTAKSEGPAPLRA